MWPRKDRACCNVQLGICPYDESTLHLISSGTQLCRIVSNGRVSPNVSIILTAVPLYFSLFFTNWANLRYFFAASGSEGSYNLS